MADDSTHVINGADTYTPGGAVLYRMVRHYWRHPEQRAELADGRAPARYRRGDFDTRCASGIAVMGEIRSVLVAFDCIG